MSAASFVAWLIVAAIVAVFLAALPHGIREAHRERQAEERKRLAEARRQAEEIRRGLERVRDNHTHSPRAGRKEG